MLDSQREAVVIRASDLYYRQNLSQTDISNLLGCSNATVSRLLSEARESGIVEVIIHRPVENVPDLALQLRSEFGLRDAVVVPNEGSVSTDLHSVGQAAASFLMSVLNDGSKLGITWGYTLHYMIKSLPSIELSGVEVIQLSGSLGQGDPNVDGPQLALRLAEKIGGICRLVPAPALVNDEATRESLIQQPQIKHVLSMAKNCDIVIQGIGTLEDEQSSLERAGYLSKKDRHAALKAGAIGHVFARLINKQGREVGDFSKRIVGISLDAMKNAEWSIGISASVKKAPAILGALRGRYFNTMIMEEASAREILRLNEVSS